MTRSFDVTQRRLIALWVVLYLLVSRVEVSGAQGNPSGTLIALDAGSAVADQINDDRFQVRYQLFGTRGQVVRLRLTVTEGDLDPTLLVVAEDGPILRIDDDGNRTTIDETLTFPADARYEIIVSRFGSTLGSTAGTYRFAVEQVGVLPDGGTTLQYGVPITNRITDEEPQLYYVLRAEAGDILDIEMIAISGTLDPKLRIVDRDSFLIAENDDASPDTSNARIENLIIDETATYVIIATRYGEDGVTAGNTVGNFVLTVDEAAISGLGNSRLVPQRIQPGDTLRRTLTDETYEHYYRFQAEANQIITVNMNRASAPGQLDTYIILADANLEPLIEDDDGGSGRDSRISQFRLPESGTYYLIATRFEGADGTTTGEYTLSLQDEGVAFAEVNPGIPRLEYGSQFSDRINDDDPDSIFAFWGDAGERVTIRMDRRSGTIDSFLELLDADFERIVFDDDSGNRQNARIEAFTLPYTGLYYIRATRFSETRTAGEFLISLLLDPDENP